jgi:hypothetical protein
MKKAHAIRLFRATGVAYVIAMVTNLAAQEPRNKENQHETNLQLFSPLGTGQRKTGASHPAASTDSDVAQWRYGRTGP